MLPTYAMADDITIGVRAHISVKYATQRWSPTIQYLQQHIPEHRFHLRPIEHINDMQTLVSKHQLDFVITQPVAYVDLERLYGVTRMLTLQKKGELTQFGSVILARADRDDIQTIKDVKNKSIAGVAKKGFGGWLIGYQELQKQNGISYKEFSKIDFLGSHHKVVNCVLKRDSDIGIVRTGIIEKMSANGDIDLSQLKVLNLQTVKGFPYKLSTQLYPEWALAKTVKVKSSIAKKIALTLLSIPKDSEVSLKGEYSEWSIPLSYNSVHELMKQQKVGSYSNYGDVSTLQFIRQHFYASILLFLLIISLFFSYILTLRSNKLLIKEKRKTEQAMEEIEVLKGIIPICSYCHSIRDDEGAWDNMEHYISSHSEASFSHGICPKCLPKARLDAGLDKK